MGKPSGKGKRSGKNYSAAPAAALPADWDAAFVAPMSAEVPLEMGGLRLDQALARLFPQYSRSRLQAWLASGHVAVQGGKAGNAALERRQAVLGGETIVLTPP